MHQSILKQFSVGKKVVTVMVCSSLIIFPLQQVLPSSLTANIVTSAYAAAASDKVLSKTGEQIVSSGVKRNDYTFKTTRSNKAVETAIHVMEIDLNNPYISLQAISGDNGTVAKRTNVMNMAVNTGAIVAINGDVFGMKNEGSPLGTQIISNSLVVSPSLLKGMYAFGINQKKEPVIDSYIFEGKVAVNNGNSFVISGINQSVYSSDVSGEAYSHFNKLFIYTSAWGGKERPVNSGATPTEVLVVDGIVTEIPEGGVVQGAIPSNGYVLRGHKDAATFLKSLVIGDQVQADYSLISQTTGAKVDPSQFEMMVSGHTLLVNNGKASSFSRDITGVSGSSFTSRTAIGYSADSKKVYMVTAEKSGSNTGLSLQELQKVLVELGVHKAINLDGGGSTTMVERKLGYTSLSLAHSTQESSLRAVANGIGVYTNAPQGQLKGMLLSGATQLFIGQSTNFTARTYDTYYNPIVMNDLKWSSSNDRGKFDGATYTALKPGAVEITAQSTQISAKHNLEIVSGKDLQSLTSNSGIGSLVEGATHPVSITAKLKSGTSYKLDGNYLAWEYVGFSGTFKDGAVIVQSVHKGATMGYAIARYDGVATMIPFTLQEERSVLENFDAVKYSLTNQVHPVGTTQGKVELVTGLGSPSTGKALQISYDFTDGTGTKASYAMFGTGGISLASNVSRLSMDVYGDGSNNWLRAEFIDSNGKISYADIAKSVNWTGWKSITFDIDKKDVAEPLKLRRLYVITLDSTKSDLAVSGSIAIDNITQLSKKVNASNQSNTIVLTLKNKQAVVSGKPVTLDVAPDLKGDYTYVPVRFVSEQLGAQVKYDSKTKKVTVLHGTKLLELQLNEKEYTLNGVKYTSEVAPYEEKGRTLVPVRLISEKLGFKVTYNHQDSTITIE